MTNLSLDRLRKGTGVFISESDFQVIQLEYIDYLKKNDLVDSEYEAEEFCGKWAEEQENLGTFVETLDGFEYYCAEGKAKENITTKELIDEMDMTSYHWENMCRSYWKIFREMLNTGNVDKQLLTNILSEETISHEQIYELQKAMKNRVAELIG